MVTIACQDMGMNGCPFVASGETMEAATAALKEHGNAVHADAMKAMMDGGMTEDALMEKMKEVAKTA